MKKHTKFTFSNFKIKGPGDTQKNIQIIDIDLILIDDDFFFIIFFFFFFFLGGGG